MSTCVHGDVCREWMRKTNSIAPLSQFCPVCVFFERGDQNKQHMRIDEFDMYHDMEHDRYIIQHQH